MSQIAPASAAVVKRCKFTVFYTYLVLETVWVVPQSPLRSTMGRASPGVSQMPALLSNTVQLQCMCTFFLLKAGWVVLRPA